MSIRQLSGKDPNYDFLEILGRGGFGTVSKVKRLSDGKIMACKAIDCSSSPAILHLAGREVSTWASFGAEEKNIASFSSDCAWTAETSTLRIYMTFYEGGDLQKVIDACACLDTTLHPYVAAFWALEVATAVKVCHARGVIHRDLKPVNVLLKFPFNMSVNDALWAQTEHRGQGLSSGQEQEAKRFTSWTVTREPWCHLTDFGLGKFSDNVKLSRTTIASYGSVGTPGYIAPESLGDNPTFSTRSDVYSLGCLLYSLCSGTAPMTAGPWKPKPLSDKYPAKMRSVIMACIEVDPKARPPLQDVVVELLNSCLDLSKSIWESQSPSESPRAVRGDDRDIPRPAGNANLGKAPARQVAKPELTEDEQKSINDDLLSACNSRDEEKLLDCLSKGAQLDATVYVCSRGPLYHALSYPSSVFTGKKIPILKDGSIADYPHITRLLIQKGARVNQASTQGITPLHEAACEGLVESTSLLLEAGANPRAADENGRVPMMYWVQKPKRELFDLLYRGAPSSINHQDRKGCTPLHTAAAMGKLEAVRILLGFNLSPVLADANIRNKKWSKPRGYMDLDKGRSAQRKAADEAIIRLLKDAEKRR